jgi:hypothetical protein
MTEIFDEGICKHDGCVLQPVEVEDDFGELPYAAWQCPACDRVFVMGKEMDVSGCDVTPVMQQIVE